MLISSRPLSFLTYTIFLKMDSPRSVFITSLLGFRVLNEASSEQSLARSPRMTRHACHLILNQ